MTVESAESEVVSLRKLAKQIADNRRESLTTAHLLVAIASRTSPAADLLMDRKLDVETLMRLARASTEDSEDAIGRVIRESTTIARNTGFREPGAIHLLVALLRNRKLGAHRALLQSGIDMARLHASSLAIANGFVEPRRVVAREARRASPHVHQHSVPESAPAAESTRSRVGKGVIVPLFPPRPTPTAVATPLPRTTEPPAQTLEERPTAHGKSALKPHRPGNRKAKQQDLRLSSTPEERYQLDPKVFPTLAAISRNLTLAALAGQLDPVLCRDMEMEQALDVLAKRRANNPLLLGPPGVGKTTIARGLAGHIVDTASSDPRVLLEIPVSHLLSGTAARGSLAERMAAIGKEVSAAQGKIVLVIDEIIQLFQMDNGEVSNDLKLALAQGQLPLIGTCTPEEYRKIVEVDPTLAKGFTVVEIEEPDASRAVEMVLGVCAGLEDHHGLPVEKEAVAAAVGWSVRYLRGSALPEKALSELDLAGARAKRRGNTSIDDAVVAEVVSEMADIPSERLLQTDRDRMLALDTLLAQNVVGHSEALARIATILRRNAAGLRSQRPIGSFLLLGPTGVGKTETAKAIAHALFHGFDAMTRLDFSEFAEPHALARLIGAPPGYVGHESGGQLTEAVRRRPYQVLLLDEFEKAHREVQQAFLQVFDEGRMTDGRGRTVDFSHTVIVMTSNLGAMEAREAAESRSIGFSSNKGSRSTAVQDVVMTAAKNALPPELYNRIDEILFFQPLTRDEVKQVAHRQLEALSRRLMEAREVQIVWTEEGIDMLLERGGYEPSLGARPVKRAIARLVEAPLAEMLLREELKAGDAVQVGATTDGKIELLVLD